MCLRQVTSATLHERTAAATDVLRNVPWHMSCTGTAAASIIVYMYAMWHVTCPTCALLLPCVPSLLPCPSGCATLLRYVPRCDKPHVIRQKSSRVTCRMSHARSAAAMCLTHAVTCYMSHVTRALQPPSVPQCGKSHTSHLSRHVPFVTCRTPHNRSVAAVCPTRAVTDVE